jgi:hypothetical protein
VPPAAAAPPRVNYVTTDIEAKPARGRQAEHTMSASAVAPDWGTPSHGTTGTIMAYTPPGGWVEDYTDETGRSSRFHARTDCPRIREVERLRQVDRP